MWSLNYIYITVTETNFKTENPVIIFFYEENDWSNKISNEKFLRLKFFESFQKFFFTTTLEVYYGWETKSC